MMLITVLILMFAVASTDIKGWVQCLRDVKLVVPTAVKSKSEVTLICSYDLEGSDLYSMKWYFGDEEFYRYVPKEEPPTRVFPINGIRVDLAESDAHRVTLLDVAKHLSGFYKCEVSADAPLFHTDIKSAYLTVVEIPKEEPTIFVDKLRYSAGETIRANCTSKGSSPAVNITWFVNGRKAPSNPVTSVIPEYGSLMESARSTFELEADATTFPNSKLLLWCTASLFDVYSESSLHVELCEDTPQIASVLGPSISDANSMMKSPVSLLVNSYWTFLLVLYR